MQPQDHLRPRILCSTQVLDSDVMGRTSHSDLSLMLGSYAALRRARRGLRMGRGLVGGPQPHAEIL